MVILWSMSVLLFSLAPSPRHLIRGLVGSGFMKKIFLVLLLGFLFSGNTFAKSKLLETKNHKAFTISTVCIDGYKFVVTNDYSYTGSSGSNAISTSVDTIQFFEVVDGKSLPKRC